jgi:hypothetical protein
MYLSQPPSPLIGLIDSHTHFKPYEKGFALVRGHNYAGQPLRAQSRIEPLKVSHNDEMPTLR